MQNLTADKYRELFRLRAEGKLPPMECSKSLFERLKKIYKPGMRILDIGGGVGHFYSVLKQLGDVDYTIVDIDSKMIDIAKDVWKDDKNVKFGVGNVNALFFPNAFFDIVICYNVLLHLSDFKDALKELIRVSKRYVIVRSLFGRKAMEVSVPVPEGYGDVYKELFYNRYSVKDIRDFLDAIDVRIGKLTFEDDKVIVSEESVDVLSNELDVKRDEFTSGDDAWKKMKLKYQVMHLEKLPKILAIIPARKGSKRLPDKNVMKFINKPLWKWTYDAAMESKYLSTILVSTDDERIIAALPLECVDVRPSELCTDDVRTEDVVKYVLGQEEKKEHFYDYVIVLQVTSPLRTAEDIDSMISFALAGGMSSIVSVVEFDKPVFGHVGEKLFVINGAMYFISVYRFDLCNNLLNLETKVYQMPIERSVDVDYLWEFEVCKLLKRLIK